MLVFGWIFYRFLCFGVSGLFSDWDGIGRARWGYEGYATPR